MQHDIRHNRTITGTNLERARAHNRRVVLEAIRQAGKLTRADLARLTSLTAQTISSIASELLDEGILLAHAPEKIPRGQPPVPLSLNPSGAYAIGFHVGTDRITGVLTDLAGSEHATCSIPVDGPGFQAALPLLAKHVDALRHEVSSRPLLGVGISVFEDRVSGTNERAQPSSPAWQGVKNRGALEAALGTPVLVEQPSAAAIMGERLHGSAATLQNFVYLFVGRDLNAGLYLGGRLYEGHLRHAGRIAHLTAVPEGRLCHCGKRGCLGVYLSGTSLAEHLGTRAALHLETVDPADSKYQAPFQAWVDEAAPALRDAVETLESLLDPELIVLGGTLPGAALRPLLERAFLPGDDRAVFSTRSSLAVRLGTTGANGVARGAAATIILSALSPDTLR